MFTVFTNLAVLQLVTIILLVVAFGLAIPCAVLAIECLAACLPHRKPSWELKAGRQGLLC